ncbi:MAG: acetolactate synthase small subunit [Verrucomicrobiales bacterium]|nr:acetolactate synthase small subunit [Verrucomicrobiales bacterium]MCP5558897.1 acetolactate synthase small subunit [Verrucomicrobiaceae bacterium]
MSDRIPATTDKKPAPQADIINIHTLSVYVNNQPGVLGRICAVFSRRGFNIESLVVSQTRDPKFSRMTIGISGHPEGLHQIIMQVNKLIDVIHCTEHTDRDAVVKEMALIKIHTGPEQRTEILQIIEHYSGKTVDLQEDSLICMISGNTDKVDAAVRMLSKFDIIETVRTGKVVMARGLGET